MKKAPKYCLTDDDIRYEFRVMVRWCRLFHKTDREWVELEAKRFRERHPILQLRRPGSRAA
ncbi:MAG: hypothetical protein ACREQ9_15385 [Candidatus Binatia bacterium]